MPIRIDERIGVCKKLVALIAVWKQLEVFQTVSDPQHSVLGSIQYVEHGIMEGITKNDLVVVVIATRDHFTIPLNL